MRTIDPRDAAMLVSEAGVRLIDIREPDEVARMRIDGAECLPLSRISGATRLAGDGPAIFFCRSGGRTGAAANRLAGLADGEAMILDGGIEAWRKAGLPVTEDRKAPLEIMRQVQIAAGSLVLLGVLLGFTVAPGFFGLSAFVGAGLAFAGATGFCGMARLLMIMPWNRRPAASHG